MKIVKFQFNMFGENCYVVYSPSSRECMIVDPGMLAPAEFEAIDGFIAREGLSVKYLVNTHMHLDHCFGNNYVSSKYGVATLAHPDDHFLGKALRHEAEMFGIRNHDIEDVEHMEPLTPGTVLTLGEEKVEVIHVPGHSPGGIALYAPQDGWVITGDSLFAGSIGRTDLPGGDHRQLIESVTRRLLSLPDSTTVLPGHGPASTIARERVSNPYL